MPKPADFEKFTDENFIHIIEGPTPTFEPVNDGWIKGLEESEQFPDHRITRLQSKNGYRLVERCHQAWNQKRPEPIYLHYRNELGLEDWVKVEAIRNIPTSEGYVVLLWVVDPPPPPITFDDGFAK